MCIPSNVCFGTGHARPHTLTLIVHNCPAPVLSYMSSVKTGAFKIDVTKLTHKNAGPLLGAIERASLGSSLCTIRI